MTIFVFLGPTLSHQEAATELGAVYLPPAEHGDIYRLVAQQPQVVGLVDGYFEQVPSVWHKEILWAMKQGIHVFGAASMGALRAAELNSFGMEGVGTIFDWYRTGVIDADDEVAVSHGTAEDDYVATSTAMVDIRATLLKAQQSNVIDAGSRQSLEQIAKSLYYPHRLYPTVFRLALEQGLPLAPIEALRDWLPAHKVDQKRDDALALLRTMRERFVTETVGPKQVRYTFQSTVFWKEARDRLRNSSAPVADFIVRSEKSSAYLQYCEKLYGRSVIQFNMMDAEQLDKLLELLKLGPDNYVLDLGCASGTLTEYMSDVTGASFTGIDPNSAAIKHAQDRTTNKAHRLKFLVGQMENLDPLGTQFDTIIAIDTLYFVKNLVEVVRQMKDRLKGQMALFYSQVSQPGLEADSSDLAHALKANDLHYQAYDFTENERRFWLRSRQIAQELQATFEAEGNLDLYEARIRESDWNIQREVRRYLYYVRTGPNQ